RIDIYGVPASGLDERYAECIESAVKIADGCNPLLQVLRVGTPLQPDSQRRQVATCQPAVGGVAFGQDQQGPGVFGECVVIQAKQSSDVDESVLLRAHREPVRQSEHLLCDFTG